MDTKQFIQDAKLRVKNDRRVWAVLAIGVVAVFATFFTQSGGRRSARPGYDMKEASAPVTGKNEGYNDLLAFVRQDLETLTSASRQQADQLKGLQDKLSTDAQKTAGILEMITERMDQTDRKVSEMATRQVEPVAVGDNSQAGMGGVGMTNDPDTLSTFGYDVKNAPPPPIPPRQDKVLYISPGDSGRVRLLTGVAAPVDGTPYPVVFKLLGPISGPDGSALNVGEARIVAAAQGSETDARVIYRLTDLAYRNTDGRRTVVKVDGWIVGEDGIRGMRGKVIDKLGQLILATMAYSGAASLAESLDDSANDINVEEGANLTVTSDDLDQATASALTDGAQRLTQLMMDKYEKLVPVVEVNSGREVAAVFSKGAEVAIYDEEEDGGMRLTSALD